MLLLSPERANQNIGQVKDWPRASELITVLAGGSNLNSRRRTAKQRAGNPHTKGAALVPPPSRWERGRFEAAERIRKGETNE